MNKSKAKGTRAESAVVKYLVSYGIVAARKALTGSNDQGDIEIKDRDIVLEVKAGQQTQNPNRTQLSEWLRQTAVEAVNSGKECILVVVRYHRKIQDSDVYIQTEGRREHLYLDEFCERLLE